MIIRNLILKDVDGMFEWMNDINICKNFKTEFNNFSKTDIENFIISSNGESNKHFAIINNENEYLGTISLKNINYIDKNAEYAIVLRSIALGTGIAQKATEAILSIAFNELNLFKVYLNVDSDNHRAIRFYEKMNFIYEGEFKKHFHINGILKDIKWYAKFNDISIN